MTQFTDCFMAKRTISCADWMGKECPFGASFERSANPDCTRRQCIQSRIEDISDAKLNMLFENLTTVLFGNKTIS